MEVTVEKILPTRFIYLTRYRTRYRWSYINLLLDYMSADIKSSRTLYRLLIEWCYRIRLC